MELTECIISRSSARDFKNIPVPENVISKLIEISSHAPSWANSQPWKVAAATGKTSEFIKSEVYRLANEGNPGNPDFIFPEFWPEEQSENIFDTGRKRYEALGIDRDNENARKELSLNNYVFFGSQTALFIYMNDKLGLWSALDCGMFIQNILLTASELGLGACPQAYLVKYPEVLREAFKLGASEKFLLGISIGYKKDDSPINKIKSERMPIDKILKIYR